MHRKPARIGARRQIGDPCSYSPKAASSFRKKEVKTPREAEEALSSALSLVQTHDSLDALMPLYKIAAYLFQQGALDVNGAVVHQNPEGLPGKFVTEYLDALTQCLTAQGFISGDKRTSKEPSGTLEMQVLIVYEANHAPVL